MNHPPLPEAWRSEAFAEDLRSADETEDTPPWRLRLTTVLIGVVPVMLATAGTALAAWVGS